MKALPIRADGCKELLGVWIEQNEGAKFWLKVMNELPNRGVEDILIKSFHFTHQEPEYADSQGAQEPGHFPGDKSATKLIYLALKNLPKKWTMPLKRWKSAMNQFTIQYGGRIFQASAR